MTTATLPAGYVLRRPTMDDVQRLFDLEYVCDVTRYGEPDVVEEDVRSVLRNQDLEHDSWLVTASDGTAMAYAGVHANEYGRVFVNISVRPDSRHKGLGTALRELVESRAHELLATVQDGVRVALSASVFSQDADSHRFAEHAGYQEIRHFWRMQIDMTEEPPTPTWPEGIVVRTFERGRDERAIFDAVEAAFSDHWGHTPNKFEEFENWTVKRDDFDPSLFFLAVEAADPDRLVGVALNWRDPWQGWIGTLGVLRPYRRRGLAEALLRHSFGEFWRRDERRVVLGVDAQSLTGAVRLYERVGMRPVRQWDSFEKEIRSGRDIARRTLDTE